MRVCLYVQKVKNYWMRNEYNVRGIRVMAPRRSNQLLMTFDLDFLP